MESEVPIRTLEAAGPQRREPHRRPPRICRPAPQQLRCRPASIEDWHEAYSSCANTTFFHGPHWSEVWSAYSSGSMRPAPEWVELPDGRAAVIGVTEERRPGGRLLRHLSPAGTYGGWVSAAPLSPSDEQLLARAVLRRGSVLWRQAPFASRLHLTPQTRRPEGDFTQVIPLTDGAAAARGRWREKARGRVNKAVKAGVRVREAASEQDWVAYYQLYRQTLARWANPSSVYGPRMFELLHGVGASGARLWLAEEEEGRLLAGALVLHTGSCATGWHQAASREGPAGAANLLHWEIIGCLAAEGFSVYDLNPSGGHDGSADFKARMGAVRQPAPFVVRLSRVQRTLGAVRRWADGRANR